MPLGATIGAAVVGAGAGIYGSSKAAKAQTSAANTAADTSLQVAQENNAFAQQMYDQNAARLDPYATMGIPAGDEYMGLLLGHAPTSNAAGTATANGWAHIPAPSAAPAAPGSGSADAAPYSAAQIAAMKNDGIPHNSANAAAANAAWYAAHPNGVATPAAAPAATNNAAAAATPTGQHATTGAGANAAKSAFDTFRNSTNYQFRLKQGLDAVNTGYAAKGAIESGAAMKAVNDYAQNMAANELSTYMDQLYRQEALGAGAASSLAGVGTNLVSQVAANNNSAGSAAANAALVAGQGSANNWNAFGAGVGQIAGAVGGAMSSSYHPSSTYNAASGAFAPNLGASYPAQMSYAPPAFPQGYYGA